MAFLIVGGVTVKVATGSPSRSVYEVGDRARAFDGTMLSRVRARKKEWTITTVPLLQADATTLETALNGALPVACSGDLTGAVNAHPVVTEVTPVKINGAFRVIVSFTISEA